MDTPNLINDINALLQKTQAPAESTTLPVPARTAPETSVSVSNARLPNADDSDFSTEFIRSVLLDAAPTFEDGDPKADLYARALKNADGDLILGAYHSSLARLALQKDTESGPQISPTLRPDQQDIAVASYHMEKADILFDNEQDKDSFLEAEQSLLLAENRYFWYRLIMLMGVTHKRCEKNGTKGIPGQLGEDVRRCAALPYASAKQYRSGMFFSLLFTAAMLFFLWYPPLRDFLVTTIQPDHLLAVCAIVVIVMFFIGGWGGAIAAVIVLGLIGGGIEHFFGEAALATTMIVLIYLVGCAILFALARKTGYSKVKRNKNHRKINKQRNALRRTLEPQLRRRLEKLDAIERATKLDTDDTPAVMYWVAMTNHDSAGAYRKKFREKLTYLRSLYQSALNSL